MQEIEETYNTDKTELIVSEKRLITPKEKKEDIHKLLDMLEEKHKLSHIHVHKKAGRIS